MSASMTTQNSLVRQMAFTPRSWTIKEQLAQAIMERDALLELKRQRGGSCGHTHSGAGWRTPSESSRRRLEALSEELRVARLELARLQALKAAAPPVLVQRRSARLMKCSRVNYKE